MSNEYINIIYDKLWHIIICHSIGVMNYMLLVRIFFRFVNLFQVCYFNGIVLVVFCSCPILEGFFILFSGNKESNFLDL